MSYLISISPTGAILQNPIKDVPTLDDLQKIVGGYIEVIPFWNVYNDGTKLLPCVAFCNEEGKLHGLPINNHAQVLWQGAVGDRMLTDHLVGTIAVVVGPRWFLNKL
jgi:Domain of unknown function (DUF3846)